MNSLQCQEAKDEEEEETGNPQSFSKSHPQLPTDLTLRHHLLKVPPLPNNAILGTHALNTWTVQGHLSKLQQKWKHLN